MMQTPDPEFEKKVLRDVVRQMKNPEDTLRRQGRLKRVILGFGTAILVVAFFLAINGLAHIIAVTGIAAFGGCVAGFGLLLESVQKQWPVTARHIDMESVQKRLDELET